MIVAVKKAEPGDQEQPATELSVLEQVLKRALESVPRDQVVKCVMSVIPATVFIDESARLHGGRVRKVSVSMPEELAEAVRARTGTGGFSRYVTEAVDRELRHQLLGELLDEYESVHGPIPQHLLDEASRAWPDYEAE